LARTINAKSVPGDDRVRANVQTAAGPRGSARHALSFRLNGGRKEESLRLIPHPAMNGSRGEGHCLVCCWLPHCMHAHEIANMQYTKCPSVVNTVDHHARLVRAHNPTTQSTPLHATGNLLSEKTRRCRDGHGFVQEGAKGSSLQCSHQTEPPHKTAMLCFVVS
jgi:hypothetical protein